MFLWVFLQPKNTTIPFPFKCCKFLRENLTVRNSVFCSTENRVKLEQPLLLQNDIGCMDGKEIMNGQNPGFWKTHVPQHNGIFIWNTSISFKIRRSDAVPALWLMKDVANTISFWELIFFNGKILVHS